MRAYTEAERRVILTDNSSLTAKQKSDFLISIDENHPKNQKCKEKLIKTLSDGVYNKLVEEICDQTDTALNFLPEGVECITVVSDDYPVLARGLSSPPLVLYCKGKTQLLQREAITVVGSRRVTTEVTKMTGKIVESLIESLVVITGISQGVEFSLVEQLSEVGNIIVALPCGFDKIPPNLKELLQTTSENGLVLSPFPPKVRVQKFNYEPRNRLMAILARCVFVTAATKTSGALYTAEYAFGYNKEVFAIPYGIFDERGAGCNQLIKKGAYLTENAIDILSTFGLECKERTYDNLTEEEKRVVSLIKNGVNNANKIAEALSIKTYELMSVITSLEIKSVIVKIGNVLSLI